MSRYQFLDNSIALSIQCFAGFRRIELTERKHCWGGRSYYSKWLTFILKRTPSQACFFHLLFFLYDFVPTKMVCLICSKWIVQMAWSISDPSYWVLTFSGIVSELFLLFILQVKFPIGEIRAMMDKKKNIRHMCVIAQVDHGKTTLTDSLVSINGLEVQQSWEETRWSHIVDICDNCITIKSMWEHFFFFVNFRYRKQHNSE